MYKLISERYVRYQCWPDALCRSSKFFHIFAMLIAYLCHLVRYFRVEILMAHNSVGLFPGRRILSWLTRP